MTRVSSKMTFFYKRVFPFLFFGMVLVVTLTPLLAGQGSHAPPLPFFFVPAFMAAFAYLIFRKLIFDLVDEVWDDGDALIVCNGRVQERIPLGNIKNVSYSTMVNPPRVTLALRQPGNFGTEVTFCAPTRLVPFSKSPTIDALIDRIDAARNR